MCRLSELRIKGKMHDVKLCENGDLHTSMIVVTAMCRNAIDKTNCWIGVRVIWN